MSNLNYGVIGNCRSAALVSESGSIDWLCWPDFDSPSVFSALLDKEKGGSFGFILPEGSEFSQAYLPETNILRTVFTQPDGAFEVLDFMPRYRISAEEVYMPPEVYRYLRPLHGKPRFRVRYEPRPDYARKKAVHLRFADFLISAADDDPGNNIYLYSSLDYGPVLESEELVLERDEFMLISYYQKLVPIDMERVHLEFERTKVYWLNWANRSLRYRQYGALVSRSLLVLKLMSFEKTGAILAAITTSIPETIGEVRNWDYRYCWLRDASMSIDTLMRMGHPHAAQRFLNFIKRIVRSKSDSFQIMYGVRGERILTEEVLDHLAGYENSRPVRIGNAAYKQQQNDSLGYILDVIHGYYHFFSGTLGDMEEMWDIVKKMVLDVSKDWNSPDHSIWEFRNRREHFVFSKIMSWVGLDRGAQIAALLGRHEYESLIRVQADLVRNDVLEKGWNEKIGSFSQSYGNDAVDASLLLMEQYGFIDANDDRYLKTVNRIKAELFHDGLMFRYKNPDDFGLPSSAFTICTFWLVRALHVTGRKEEAAELLAELASLANHVGLFSEDLDFVTKRQLGNFPQAYSHLALIDVVSLIGEEKNVMRFIKP